jgi:hypothetical protein
MEDKPTVKKDKCRSCGAPIVWAKTTTKAKKVKSLPYDLEPNENGAYALFHPGGDMSRLEARYIQRGGDWPPGTVPRTNHFATCPQRKEWAGSTRRPSDPEREGAQRLVDEYVEEQRRRESEEEKTR